MTRSPRVPVRWPAGVRRVRSGTPGPKGDPAVTRIDSFTRGFTTTDGWAGTVSFIGDGVVRPVCQWRCGLSAESADTGLNGQPVSALKFSVDDIAYKTSGVADAPIGSPYFRIFTTDSAATPRHGVHPPSCRPTPTSTRASSVEVVPSSARCANDDPGSTPRSTPRRSWPTTRPRPSAACASRSAAPVGPDLEALLRWGRYRHPLHLRELTGTFIYESIPT